MASFKIASLQKALEDSIPHSELDRTNKKLLDVTEKYRDNLEKGNSLVSKAEALTGLEVCLIVLYFGVYSVQLCIMRRVVFPLKVDVKNFLPMYVCIVRSENCVTG